jgi:hypothetical protein
MKPGAARKAQEQSEQQNSKHGRIDKANAARDHAVEEEKRRPDQERPVNIGILKGPGGTPDRCKHLAQAVHVEIAERAEKHRNYGGDDVGDSHRGEPRHGL